tara:strand:+ start:3455 stop:4393 length:939 start_codon:yes stop_codon:yes gene_type:complete
MDNTILKFKGGTDPRFDEALILENFGTTINFQTIFVCNLNCYFCRGSIKNIDELTKTKTMSQNNFEIFINKATDYGINHIQITPAVGEPFLDKGIEDKILFLENNDKIKFYMVTTNLTQLTDKHINLIKKCKKLYLTVSVYGYDKESYIKNTNRDRYNKFIDRFKEIGDIFYNKQTESLLELNIRCEKKFDINFPKTKIYYIIHKLLQQENIKLNTNEVYNTNRADNLDNFEYVERKKTGICPFGPGDGGGVLPNGDFLFCAFNDLEQKGKVGNLLTQTLEEIYNSPLWLEVVNSQKNNIYKGICAKCSETW